MKAKRLFFCLNIFLFVLFLTKSSYPQGPDVKWGEIPKKDLEMKTFPDDENASAVILYDKGDSYLDDYLHIIFKRHLRVKILNNKGYEWGTHSVDIHTGSSKERIEDIEGVTYWLEDNGNIASSKLSSKDVFEEKVTDRLTRFKFTLPSLKPGCIIEIRYNISSEHIFYVRGWEFQHNEPVVWSEYNFRSPKAMSYSSVTQGTELYVIRGVDDEATQVFSGAAEAFFGRKMVPCIQRRWAVANAPALRDEPFTTTVDDYKNKVDIQLTAYVHNGMITRVVENWEKLVNELMNDNNFGKKIDDTRKVKKLAQEITANLSTPKEKMIAIYDWVATSIVWTEGNRAYAKQEVNDILESKKGNNAEITFLLLSLLKSVEIEGEPIMLSTRSNGKIQTLYPILYQFNYVLARVKIDSTSYFLDATDPLRPYDVLPYKVLNVKGLVVKEDVVEWVDIPSNKKSYNAAIVNIRLNQDGSFTGSIEDLYRDIGALNIRHTLKDKSAMEAAKTSFSADKTGLVIDSVQAFGKDTISIACRLMASVSSSNYAQCNGDLIYINPHIINRMWENPFKARKREFPIDYGYTRSNITVINITLPDSFEVKEKLEDAYFTSCMNELVYTRNSVIEGNILQIKLKLDIKSNVYPSQFYTRIKEFYEKIVSSGQEQIVLSRIKKTPAPAIEQKTESSQITGPAVNKAPEQKAASKKKKK